MKDGERSTGKKKFKKKTNSGDRASLASEMVNDVPTLLGQKWLKYPKCLIIVFTIAKLLH